MAFTIQMGQYTGRTNVISKQVNFEKTFTGTIRDEGGINLKMCTVTIQTNEFIRDLNYAYIEEFGYYYYVREPRILRNGMWQFTFVLDVLKSYEVGILASEAKFNRSYDFYNTYLNDERAPITARAVVTNKIFPDTPFDGDVASHGVVVTLLGPS